MMILSTTHTLEGKHIGTYLGVVSAETVIGVNIVNDMFAAVTDVIGGRSGTLERSLKKAREACLKELEERALALGADAIVGISIDTDTGTMTHATAIGTAVKLRA